LQKAFTAPAAVNAFCLSKIFRIILAHRVCVNLRIAVKFYCRKDAS